MSQVTRPKEEQRPAQEENFQPATRRRRWSERLFRALIIVATLSGIAVLGVLIVDVLVDGLPRLSWDFITSFDSQFNPESAGIYPALLGTLWLVVLTTLLTVPLGIGAAVYLEEYANDNWLTRIVEVNISNLAGVPSVIYGVLALGLFVNYLGPLTGGSTIISGALALTLLVLPVIIIAGREAVRAVPEDVREGAFALGATRWEVIWSHVLPMALPGALTGTILALSRAVGETAPLLVVGAAAYINFAPEGPQSQFTALPIQIYSWASRPEEAFQVTAAAAGIIVLLVILLSSNSIAIALRNWLQRRR